MEKKVQTKLIKFLRSKGFYVIKTHPGMGTPTGCPDVIALGEGFYCCFECKGSKVSKWQPLQRETIEKLNVMSFAWAVYPENYDDVICLVNRLL